MDDVDIDRELRHALQVTPSPEFVARVRASISEASRPSIFGGVLVPAFAIACAAVLAVGVGMWRQDVRIEPSRADVTGSQTEAAPAMADVNVSTSQTKADDRFPPSAVQPKIVVSAPAALVQVHTPVEEEPLPEVIIAPADREALQQFVASATELRFVASFEEPPAPVPYVVTELTIPPLTIRPLDPEPSMND